MCCVPAKDGVVLVDNPSEQKYPMPLSLLETMRSLSVGCVKTLTNECVG